MVMEGDAAAFQRRAAAGGAAAVASAIVVNPLDVVKVRKAGRKGRREESDR